MAKKKAEDDGAVKSEKLSANGEDNQPHVGLLFQYVKDLSVENPNSPSSLNWDDQPQVDVQVNIQVHKVSDDVHEVEMILTTKATSEQGVLYAVELSYAGLFGIRNVPEPQSHEFLFGEAPRLIFPFARRVIADATRDAGFPPLTLDPIDFNMLYMQQRAQAEELAKEQPAGEA